MTVHVALCDDRVLISFPYNPSDVERLRALPDSRFDKAKKIWSAPATAATVRTLQEFFGPRLVVDKTAGRLLEDAEKSDRESATAIMAKAIGIDTSQVPGDDKLIKPVAPDGTPQRVLEHQRECLALGGRSRRFAILLDTGTGKTFVYLADGVWAWRRGSIDTLVIMTMNNVKRQIVEKAIPRFVPADVPLNVGMIQADRTLAEKRAWDRFVATWEGTRRGDFLNILVVNYEALDRLWDWIADRVNKRTMIIADESTRIKALPKKHKLRGPQNRSAKALEIRALCGAARIGSGYPFIKRPLDAWTQLCFLDRSLLPWGSFAAFKAHFCVTGGYQGRQILFYKNLDDLSMIVAGCSYRRTKDQCLDLPPKMYERREVAMTKAQAAAYQEMRKEAFVILDEKAKVVSVDDWIREYSDLNQDATEAAIEDDGLTIHRAPIVLTLMMRLQQIVSGFLPVYGEVENKRTGEMVTKVVGYKELVDPAENPKFVEALEIIEDAGEQKVIVWSRFRPELAAFAALLTEQGINFVEFHGGIGEAEREVNKARFIEDPECRVFLGNQAAGGVGTDGLQVAGVMIYLSNDLRTENRIQSEDRGHRLGLATPLTIFDIVVPATVDIRILSVLRENKSLSDVILGDDPKEWI